MPSQPQFLSLFFFAKLRERTKKKEKGTKVNLQRVSYAHVVWLYVLIDVCRKEAVTLPENKETDFGDIEQSLNFSNTTATMGFQQTTYFALVCYRPPLHCPNDQIVSIIRTRSTFLSSSIEVNYVISLGLED